VEVAQDLVQLWVLELAGSIPTVLRLTDSMGHNTYREANSYSAIQ